VEFTKKNATLTGICSESHCAGDSWSSHQNGNGAGSQNDGDGAGAGGLIGSTGILGKGGLNLGGE